MAAPATVEELLDLVRKSGVVEGKRLDAYLERARAGGSLPGDVGKAAGALVRDGLLTQFQAEQLLLGKWRRFTIGKYKVLEKLGAGGMGSVFLCEHKFMRRRVAVKVLPTARAEDSSALDRFYREAKAVAALDHPNIVRAYDIDQDDRLHFLVMEYIDGSSLQTIVKRHGPLDVVRAAHYIRQAAQGLQHAHEKARLVHRDIKPGNILVDRAGVVKILDMGLARFFNDEESLITKKYDENVLGTADYLAPEQAIDSHGADIRADIYSLGATFYFCVTGQTPFQDGSVAQKLIWHQTRPPRPVRELRPEVPEGLAAVIDRMMAKDREKRYQSPAEVVAALEPWTQEPVAPPPEQEMPRLSPAAAGPGDGVSRVPSATPVPATRAVSRPGSGPVGVGALTAPRTAEPSSEVAWDQLAPETDATLRPDTAPHSIRRHLPAARRGRRWGVLVAAGAGAVVAVGVLVWALNRPGDNAHPVPSPAPEAAVLRVSASGENGAYRTIREALAKAKAGDRVVVLDARVDQPLSLIEMPQANGVTIEGGLPNRGVRWESPARGDEPLVVLQQAAGVRLKGFTLDGQGHARDLIRLTGHCPGVVLEDLKLTGFARAAVAFWNCAGGPEGGAVRLKGVRVTSGPRGAPSALVFSANPHMQPPQNEHVEVTDGRFEGPYTAAAVVFGGPALDVKFEGNRFYRAAEGFRFAKASLGYPLRLTLKSNTFYDVSRAALRFEALPPAGSQSRVAVENNLFGKTAALAQADNAAAAAAAAGLLVRGGNVRDPESKEGNVPLVAAPLPFKPALDPQDDARFLRYPSGDPLARAGLSQLPVGAAVPGERGVSAP